MTLDDDENWERTERATVPPPLWGRSTREARREGDAPRRAKQSIVPILRSGVLAQQFCQSVARAKVEAVFERSLYLRCGDEFICVGGPDVGNGPLTLIGNVDPLSRFRLQPGQSASVCERHITIGNSVRFTLDQSEPWRAPPWPVCATPLRLIETCAVLASRAASEAPEEGFARYVLAAPEMFGRQPLLARVARTHIAVLESWLSGVLDAGHATTVAIGAPIGLIGLGPGLTPSGDDFLVGALALLGAIGESDAHAALARAMTDALPTSPLSACFLRAAAAGHVGENLHRAVASIMTGDVDAAVAAVASIGHSSGWDMMAGIATTLRIAAQARLKV